MTDKLRPQFDQDIFTSDHYKAVFQASLAKNAIIIYEEIKNDPGVEFIDGTDLQTAVTLKNAGLVERKRNGKWFVVPRKHYA